MSRHSAPCSSSLTEVTAYSTLDSRSDVKNPHSGRLIQRGTFRFRTLEESKSLAFWLAHSYPDPERATYGLHELFTNAIEHGNLDIGYQLKSTLVEEHRWDKEIARRLNDARYAHRYVEVIFVHDDEGVHVSIIDQGKGFAWDSYLTIDPMRMADLHGRGIAVAALMSFDRITYHGLGNHVTTFVHSPKHEH
ncbi:MAG: ATP-binding protein [Alphaproteobacteria bacterium]|nr:MAG: ATP-binding protein [Alphaproteobacteria bacterium]